MNHQLKAQATPTSAVHSSRRRGSSGEKRRRFPPWFLPLLPILILLAGVLFWPMIQAVIESARVDEQWGIGNYSQVLSDRVFRSALLYTLAFTVTTVLIELCLGMGAALLLDGIREPWKRIATTAAILPYLVAPIAVAMVWRLMFDYNIGTVNWFLGALNIPPVIWLGDATPAFWATVVAEVWTATPFVLIILLAGLTAIPHDVVEAGRIDGASSFRIFALIKLPLLRPAIAVALLFSTIFKLRLFELPFILTGGGPGDSTTPLGLLVYQYYFRYYETGQAAVVSVVLLIVGAVIAYAYIKWVYREVDY